MSSTDIVRQTQSAARMVELQDLGRQAREMLAASTAASTASANRSDWRHFTVWCDEHGLESLPATPETVTVYLSALAETHKPATLRRRVATLAVNHRAAGYESPTRSAVVSRTLEGVARTKGTAQAVKAPLTVEDLRVITRDHLPAGLRANRDRALLLLGFAGAFRRSELVGIDREHLGFVPEGVVVTLRRSKTDQEGAGRKVAIPYGQNPETCAVRALAEWLASAPISSGPVFRPVDRHGNVGAGRLTGKSIALTVKNYIQAIGKDPAAYAGHSLRAGFATAAARAGAEERDIMRQTGHRSTVMVRRYIRDGSLFRSNAASVVGL
jgi:site-specific recombinase XerD